MQAKDLIVSGASRFLNTINGNINGTASNVTGTVAIANGGTGATTRLGAAKALTDETVATPGFVVGLTDSWGKFGYTSIANLKTTLGAMTPASHTHGNIQNGGTLQTTDITIASGDKLVVTDSSDSAKIARTSISFDGSTTTKCLTQKGTWETFGTSNLTLGTTSTTALKGDTKYAGADTAGGSATSAQQLKFTASSTDAGYPIAFCSSENPISQGSSIESAGVHSNLKFNPSSSVLTVGVNNSDYPKSFASITYNSTNPQINVTYQPNASTLNSSVLSKSGLSVTQNSSSLNIAYNDLTFSASSNPPTWDGTNTSLVTAITAAKETVTQTTTTSSNTGEYRVLVSKSTNDTTETSNVWKAATLTYSPYLRTMKFKNSDNSYLTVSPNNDGSWINVGKSPAILLTKPTTSGSGAMGVFGFETKSGRILLATYPSSTAGNEMLYFNYYSNTTLSGSTNKIDQKMCWDGASGSLALYGGNYILGTPDSSSNDSSDILFVYGNTNEKARLWTENSYSSGLGINWRVCNTSGTTIWTGKLQLASSSDIRLKENVKDTEVDKALDIINQIKIRSFDWKNMDKHQKIGFVADELEKIDSNFVDEGSGGYNKFGDINPKSVNNFYMLGYIVKAIQELSQENEKLKAKIKELQ